MTSALLSDYRMALDCAHKQRLEFERVKLTDTLRDLR
jgi:hypothetical protein